MANNFKFVQAQPFTLAGAGVAEGDGSMTLSSFTQIDGTLLTMTDFGAIGFGTVEPGNGTQEEQISFTGVSQNDNGTATLTGISHVSFVSPYTKTANFSLTHGGGVQFVITNTAGFYDQFVAKDDDGTISEVLTFTVPNYPRVDDFSVEPTDSAQFATKYYVDQTAVSGAPNATSSVKGIVQLATGTQAQAGTGLGSTGASLVPPNSLFNATTSANILVPVTNTNGKISAGFGGSASSLATLDTNTLVVQNPANATTVSTAAKIPIADGNGKITTWVQGKFGGTGSDGALTISSGVTTINLSNAAVVVKNYTSISITGTGSLAFSNPNANGSIIILKSQGDVILTSSTAPMIDASALGAAGGTAGVNGSLANAILDDAGNSLGVHGGNGSGGTGGASGAAGTAYLLQRYYTQTIGDIEAKKSIFITPGSGGGGGGAAVTSGSTAGAGGRGGGALKIECGGAWNFTTANGISVAGAAGTNGGAGASGNDGGAGAGGGGAPGMFIGLYNSLTANTGTVNAVGGAGGTGGNVINNGSSSGGGGGGGGSALGAGGAGGAGASGANNGAGGSNASGSGAGGGGGGGAASNSSGTRTGGAGGTGSTGIAVVALNSEFF